MALTLVVLVVLRFLWLRGETQRRWEESLIGGAATTQATVDDWFIERRSDAEALAASLSVHSDVVAGRSSDGANSYARILAPMARRGRFVAVWVLDEQDRVLASSDSTAPSVAELVAVRESRRSGRPAPSLVEMNGARVTLSIAAPVEGTGDSAARRPASVVVRTDVIAAFSPWAAGRPNAAMSVFATPAPRGGIIIAGCPERTPPVCVTHKDTMTPGWAASAALAGVDSFGVFDSFDGERVLAVTRFDTLLQWGVVRRVRVDHAYQPFWRQVALEGAFLAAVVALVCLAAFARDRAARARELHERAESDQRMAAILEAATDGLVSLDASRTITMTNAAADRLLGYERGELTGRSVLEIFAPEWRTSMERALARFTDSAATTTLLAEGDRGVALRSDGSTIPVDARLGRAELGGEPVYTLGLHDVSERVRTERFLSGQRRVLELIASGAPAVETLTALIEVVETEAPEMRFAVYELEADGVVARVVCGPRLASAFLEATEDIVVGPTSAAVGTCIYRGESVYATDIATDPLWADSRIYVLAYGIRAGWAAPLRSADGRVVGALACYYREARGPSMHELELSSAAVHLASIAVSSARDETSLRASEASFRSFVENAPAAIFRETRYGRLVSANPAMIGLLGYGDVEALQEAAERKTLYLERSARERLLAQLEAHDVVRGLELEWCRADGSRVTVRVSARAYRDDRDDVWLWEGFAEDVTLLRAAEQALRHNERLAAVGQLISGVAHELNNPLSSIMHFAEDLLADERTPDDAEALGVIRDQARRSRAIVRDLLSFVRQRNAAAEPLVLAEIVRATLRVMRPTLELHGALLHSSGEDVDAVVLADRGGVEQIVTNLVSNAVQAAGEGGNVWVRVERSEGNACDIVVEDDGPGIPVDIRPRIFDPFFTTKATGEGTGLGLSVTLGIVEQLGGRIALVPRAGDARGSCFVVTIPCAPEGVSARRAARPAPAPPPPTVPAAPRPPARRTNGRARHALVIDDEPTIRAALQRYFTRRGWEVEQAADGAAGLAILDVRGDTFDVVISDLRMPGFSGVQLHDRLSEDHPELLSRVVFSTGDVASREAASFVQRTTCPVLQKPFELRMLDDVIATLDARGAAPERVDG